MPTWLKQEAAKARTLLVLSELSQGFLQEQATRAGTDAEDLKQMVAERAYKALLKGSWPNHSRGWIHTIVRHLATDLWRRRRRTTIAVAAPLEDSGDLALWHVLSRTYQSLPDDQQQIFLLYFFERKTMAEIGRLLGMPGEDRTRRRAVSAVITKITEGIDAQVRR